MNRKILLGLALSQAIYSQTVTPYVQLQIPITGLPGYAQVMSYSINRIDSIFGGVVPVPAFTLGYQSSAPSAPTSSNTIWSKSSDGNLYVEYPSALSYRLGLMATATVTANDCVKWDTNGNLADNGSGCSGVNVPTFTGIVKATASSATLTQAIAGTDYTLPPTGTAIQKANGSGGLTAAIAGTDYAAATSGSGPLATNNAGGFFNLNYPIYVTQPPYSADRTGTTDATTAIQSALTACGAGGGGIVLFPPGTYKTSATLTIPDGCSVEGFGASAESGGVPISGQALVTRIVGSGISTHTNPVLENASPNWTGHIQNIILDGGNNTYIGLLLTRSTSASVKNVTLVNILGSAPSPDAALTITDASNDVFENIVCASCAGKALWLHGDSTYGATAVKFIGGTFFVYGDDAIVVDGEVDDVTFINPFIASGSGTSGHYGVVLNYTSSTPTNQLYQIIFIDAVIALNTGNTDIYATNNAGYNVFYSPWVYAGANPLYTNGGGGYVKVIQPYISGSGASGAASLPNDAFLTVGSSPYTYTNNYAYALNVYVPASYGGGSLTLLQKTRNGYTFTVTGSTTIQIEPGESVILTYTGSAPLVLVSYTGG